MATPPAGRPILSGGVALLRSIKRPWKIRTRNEDQKARVHIVRKSLSHPARQIALNAGDDGPVVVVLILDKEKYNSKLRRWFVFIDLSWGQEACRRQRVRPQPLSPTETSPCRWWRSGVGGK
jgi:hypothetical protein